MLWLRGLVTSAFIVVRVSGLLVIDGISVKSDSTSPSNQVADCCPLRYDSVVAEVDAVAGLSYTVELFSGAASLSPETTARLRIAPVGHVAGDADCDPENGIVVLDFVEPSAVDGSSAPTVALSTVNEWQATRFPYSTTFQFCYGEPEDDGGMIWHSVSGATVVVHGAAWKDPTFRCAAMAGVLCVIHVKFADTAARVRLVSLDEVCGMTGAGLMLRPFSRNTSLPSLATDGADHGFGTYASQSEPASYRVCFCHGFENDNSTDGSGYCRSSDASDFPQTLGVLHLLTVTTNPTTLYPGRRFSLEVHCGSQESKGGCSSSQESRVKLVNDVGEAEKGNCGILLESDLHGSPDNCLGHDVSCTLTPSQRTEWLVEWHNLVLRPKVVDHTTLLNEFGVCFCDAVCNSAKNWGFVGRLLVEPLGIFPNQFRVGVTEDVQLVLPGGDWGYRNLLRVELKFIFDPAGIFDVESDEACLAANQTIGTLTGHDCTLESDCTAPSRKSGGKMVWQDLKILKAGSYSICYCDGDCWEDGRWTFVSWHWAVGPVTWTVGTVTQGQTVYVASRFDISITGVGLSPDDQLAFVPGDSDCQGPPSSRERHVDFGSPDAELPMSSSTGGIVVFQAIAIGIEVTMASPHGILKGDFVRFSGVKIRSDGYTSCPALFSELLQRNVSRCTEALVDHSVEVTLVPSQTQAVIPTVMTPAECAALDFSDSRWLVTSRERFSGFIADRKAHGRYTICWGQQPHHDAEFAARVGMLDVQRPQEFRSGFHVTSAAPDVATPSIVAFETGNAIRYSAAEGQLSFKISFRDTTRLRHAIKAASRNLPPQVPREEATQSRCGVFFQELWSDAEDGFPQPAGCFYDEKIDEYGMLFSEKAGLRPGTRYQIVLLTHLTGSLVQEHDWTTRFYAAPVYPFAPTEIQNTVPDTWGDIGMVASAQACKEECARLKFCNVAIYHADTDSHCLLADFSNRIDPFETQDTRLSNRTDIMLFMLDRLNRTHPELQYQGPLDGKLDVALDLWSMDDVHLYPFGVIEASEATKSVVAALPPAAPDPRWNTLDGLKVLPGESYSDVAEGKPFPLDPNNPELHIRLRAAPGAAIRPKSLVRLILWPLTQWTLPRDCLVKCTPHTALMKCGYVECEPAAIVISPWVAARNTIRLVLPADMDPITDVVMHTLALRGGQIPVPDAGFLPTRIAAEVSPAETADAKQPRVDYSQSVGGLPYAPLSVFGSVILEGGGQRPFAGDALNVIYVRLRFGSVVRSRPAVAASFQLWLPEGYICHNAAKAASGLPSLVADGGGQGLEGRGELGEDGHWSFDGNLCSYTFAPNAAVYGGSSIVVALTVNNPPRPMPAYSPANTWSILLSAPGEASEAVHFPRLDFDDGAETASQATRFARSVTVFGRFRYATLVPMDFWVGAPRNSIRIFIQPVQSTGVEEGLIRLIAPAGFGFAEKCRADDLPRFYYRPLQGQYSSGVPETLPLGQRRGCSGFQNPADDAIDARLSVAEISTGTSFNDGVVYAFQIKIIHPRVYNLSGRVGFAMTTFASNYGRRLDYSDALPLAEAFVNSASPSYGIYQLQGSQATFEPRVASMLPFMHTGAPTTVTILIRVPLEKNSTNEQTVAWSTGVSWRVTAPTSYAWTFSREEFWTTRRDVEGITADLPILYAPACPVAHPRNTIVFPGESEHQSGWQEGEIYGFRASIKIPPETPRHGVNEWIAEWGYDGQILSKRAIAVRTAAQEVRAIHSLYAWSLITDLQSQNNELLFQFGLVTTVPNQLGALIIEAPAHYTFDKACVPFNSGTGYEPFQPITIRLDCSSEVTTVLRVGGTVPPRVVLRAVDRDLTAGLWFFHLACVNPPSVDDAAVNPRIFTLLTYTSYTDDTNSAGTNAIADVSASTAGPQIKLEIPTAEIVNDVDYLRSGRDDHPGQPSSVVMAFELRTEPLVFGTHVLEVQAPSGFYFRNDCRVDIGASIFGHGLKYPSPYVPFETGVRIISCIGYFHKVKVVVSPGLRRGRLYAFSIRINKQPEGTPVKNEWRLAYAGEASVAIPGYKLWGVQNFLVAMLSTSRIQEGATVENPVTFSFTLANSIRVRGMLMIVAPRGFKIRLDCHTEIYQVAITDAKADVKVPGVACLGEQPPTNRARIRLQSDEAMLADGVRYRLTIEVSNPTFLSPSSGYWMLSTYSHVAAGNSWTEPLPEALLDIGRVISPQIAELFQQFTVKFVEAAPVDSVTLPLTIDIALPVEIAAGEILQVLAPVGYDFARPVIDDSLEGDLRQCLSFENRAGPEMALLPVPVCAGPNVQFPFRTHHAARAHFRFRIMSDWPRNSLDVRGSTFKAVLLKNGSSSDFASSIAYLNPIAPRLRDFFVSQVGGRADAVSSVGSFEITLTPCQEADLVDITTRVKLQLGKHARFDSSTVQVRANNQVLKDVGLIHDGPNRLLILLHLQAGRPYIFKIHDVMNPDAAGILMWTARTYARTNPLSELIVVGKTEAFRRLEKGNMQIAGLEEVTTWLLDPANARDEMADLETSPIVSRINAIPSIESGFFDFFDTAMHFTMSIAPRNAPVGYRLLIFAPFQWTFVEHSFFGGAYFPDVKDLGILQCLDGLHLRLVAIYAVRLLNMIRTIIPCKLNPGKNCENNVHFSLKVNTPPTPSDLGRWKQSDHQAWLLQMDGLAVDTCSDEAVDHLNPQAVEFSNDASFRGFQLKESLGRMAVQPEPRGVRSKQHVTMTIDFSTGSILESHVAGKGLFLRVQAVEGLAFDKGCLAAVPDPDYAACDGRSDLAVVTIRERVFASGEHRLALAATNPPWTPNVNLWTLETYVDVDIEVARSGFFQHVKQRGRTQGYDIEQTLQVQIRPTTTEVNENTLLLVWFRPGVFVEPLGFVEFHAGQSFGLSCTPGILLISLPTGACKSYIGSSTEFMQDFHSVVEFQVGEGNYLLSNREYEFGLRARNPGSVGTQLSNRWGLRLTTSLRLVLEANMDINQYRLSSQGFSITGLLPGITSPWSRNEIRIRLSFAKNLTSKDVSEIYIEAPPGFDFRPLCNRFQDATGVCPEYQDCDTRLPRSKSRGGNACPTATSLIMYLDPFKTVHAGTYVLLVGAMNPAALGTRNLWMVSLLAPTSSSNPEQTVEDVDGSAVGRRVVSKATALGFHVGYPQNRNYLPAVPLEGEVVEVFTGSAQQLWNMIIKMMFTLLLSLSLKHTCTG